MTLLLFIYTDSKVIIEWEKCCYDLQVLQLKHWFKRAKYLISSFQQISLSHFSRRFNMEANQLSKQVVLQKEGYMHYQEVLEGSIINEGMEDICPSL